MARAGARMLSAVVEKFMAIPFIGTGLTAFASTGSGTMRAACAVIGDNAHPYPCRRAYLQ
jgi:hypothetical protein